MCQEKDLCVHAVLLMHLQLHAPLPHLRGWVGQYQDYSKFSLHVVPNIGDFDNSNKMIEFVILRERVKGGLRRSSGVLFFESEKAMQSNEALVLHNFYSRVVKDRNLKEDVKQTFSDVLPSKAQYVEDQAGSARVVEYFTICFSSYMVWFI